MHTRPGLHVRRHLPVDASGPHTYDFLFYLNADERRERDLNWSVTYTLVSTPVVRTLIDILYNIIVLLENPFHNAPLFRKSGYRKMLRDLDEDEHKYGQEARWRVALEKGRENLLWAMRLDGFKEEDVRDRKSNPDWLTLGAFLAQSTPAPHLDFLKTFTYGPWRQYSAISHGAFEGLSRIGMYLNRDGHRHEDRPLLDALFPREMSLHIGRSALLLLCSITEIQGKFRFQGAQIKARIHQGWTALRPLFEAGEVYDSRYKRFMEERRMRP